MKNWKIFISEKVKKSQNINECIKSYICIAFKIRNERPKKYTLRSRRLVQKNKLQNLIWIAFKIKINRKKLNKSNIHLHMWQVPDASQVDEVIWNINCVDAEMIRSVTYIRAPISTPWPPFAWGSWCDQNHQSKQDKTKPKTIHHFFLLNLKDELSWHPNSWSQWMCDRKWAFLSFRFFPCRWEVFVDSIFCFENFCGICLIAWHIK